ncbi:SIR2 family protein [Pontibacter beigongshangensis]|uniref:SIR2 family protein n=1 Tax=Pontibacter beigongshangensis TaxID=2574733 RepID=UPI00164F37B1|nr:SIR2 family protein [Pontibacter beigongshangensis]
MDTVTIVGSGFNYIIAGIVKQYTQEKSNYHLRIELEQTYDDLLRINNLWGELDDILNSPTLAFPSKNGEEIMQYFQSVFESSLFKNMMSRDYDIEYSAASHQNLLQNEIKRIGYRSTEFEKRGGYSNIKRLLPNLGENFLELLIKNNISKMHIYTLNYDGILDTLLTRRGIDNQGQEYLFKDSFYFSEFQPWKLKSLPYLMAHLHGSYKYKRGKYSTSKVGRKIVNDNPVMIYNSPKLKETLIKEDPVLKAYYSQLTRDLQTYQRLVILGCSFKTEPHLKQLIEKYFDRHGTEVIVCSNKPEEVVSVLEPHYSFPIYTQSTEHVKSERQLIELFDRLFGAASMDIRATA